MANRRPEIWDPVSGRRWDASVFTNHKASLTVPLEFGPNGSLFVLFRKPLPPTATAGQTANFPELRALQEVNGPWEVAFDPNWGAPAQVRFEQLADWTARPEPGIRYYSGKATYHKTFDCAVGLGSAGSKRHIVLDLGTVRDLAVVRLNGQELGVVWCWPWRVDVTGVLREKDNRLEIEVINLWPNRLIGDGKLPVPRRLTATNIRSYDPPKGGAEHALRPSGLLGPVVIQVEN